MSNLTTLALTAASLLGPAGGITPVSEPPTQSTPAQNSPTQPATKSLPIVEVTNDNTKITESCLVRIEPGAVIADSDNNGVIQIDADDITVKFEAGSELRGAASETPWDTLKGVGIRIDGHHGVKLQDAKVHGFKVGIYASNTPGLDLLAIDASDNYRQHLKSTPVAEDASDWLYPHHNDGHEWMNNYGAAVYIERSDGVFVREVKVRRGQNGIILDRVNGSQIYDNDCSFLSGWGIAMWRSSGNIVSRNLLDFCVRGHVEGVYNRGQDSAGILLFEQCSNNQIVENSASWCGDGFFGFAGIEAIGESPAPAPDFDYKRRGCNDNIIQDNDFSFAAAHGLELTFSYGNIIARNRMIENAICGIWGGYSQDFLIIQNQIHGNGGMAYGLERGGINIEHGSGNRIYTNNMQNNRCGIHLWWDDDKDLLQKPGVKANYRKGEGNKVASNAIMFDRKYPIPNFRADEKLIALQIRDPLGNSISSLGYAMNKVVLKLPNAVELDVPPGVELVPNGALTGFSYRQPTALGATRPIMARKALRGRQSIIMTEWGPWDHESPLVRQASAGAGSVSYDLFKFTPNVDVRVIAEGITPAIVPPTNDAPNGSVTLKAPGPGVYPYEMTVSDAGFRQTVRGVLIAASWDVTFFPWTADADPREKLDAWRALASGGDARGVKMDSLTLKFGMGGPANVAKLDAAPGNDHFGTIARTTLHVPKGRWTITTTSDDGVRVLVDGKPVIENWTWHGPTRDTGTFTVEQDRDVPIVVEHFEIDGYATLEFELAPTAAPASNEAR